MDFCDNIRFDQILDLCEESAFITDTSWNLVFVNKAFSDFFGYKKNEITGRNMVILFKNDVSNSDLNKITISSCGDHITGEDYAVMSDGANTPVKFKFSPLKDENKTVKGYIFFITRINEFGKVLNLLKENEERYRQMFENNLAIKLLIEAESGRIIDANSSAAKFYGYEIEKLKTMNISEISILSAFELSNEIKKATEEKRIFLDFKHRLSSGEIKDVEVFSGHVTLHKKRYLYSIIIDVSDKKKAEKKLEISEKRYRLLFENMFDGFVYCKFLFDSENNVTDYIFIDCNESFEKYTGLKKEKIIGKKVSEIYSGNPETAENLIKRYGEASSSGAPANFEYYSKKLNKWFKVLSYRPSPEYFTAIFSDITNQKAHENELLINKKRLETLLRLNQMDDTNVNQLKDFSLEEAIKLTESEIGFLMFKPNDDDKLILHQLSKKTFENGSAIDLKSDFNISDLGIWTEPAKNGIPLMVNDYSLGQNPEYCRQPGHIEIKRFICIPVFDDNKLAAVAAVANKNVDYNENDLNQLLLLMEGMWKVIQRKNSEELLKEANEKLMELDRMKTDFLSTVSHELRTPLTSILGFIKIIKKKLKNNISNQLDIFDEKTKKNYLQVMDNIDIIEFESIRLTALINDVLDVAKMEARKVEWIFKEVSLTEVIERSINSTASLLEKKKLKLFKQFEENLPLVNGDFDRLMQVVINLISNAVKFTETGHIKISTEKFEESVKVSITDTGIGIAESLAEEIFEKFKQVSDTISNKPAGTGLGLAICKQIVEVHAGKIWCESKSGEGSTFIFTIPGLKPDHIYRG